MTFDSRFHILSEVGVDGRRRVLGYPSLEAAKARYDQQVKHRASEGFVHSFYIEFDDITLIPRHRYRRLEGS
jgi:hypothetical protein